MSRAVLKRFSSRRALFFLATGFCLLATVAAAFAHLGWLNELCTHFRAQYALWLAAAAALSWWLKGWKKLAVVCLAAALFNASTVVPLYFGRKSLAASASVRLVQLNVNKTNKQKIRTLDFLRKANPDLILVEEVDDAWLSALRAGLPEYSQGVSEPRSDYYGIALLSRIPLDKAVIVRLGPETLPAIEARFTLDGQPVALFGVHPPPPVSPTTTRVRNRQLQSLARLVVMAKVPTIVAGDLNTSSFSPVFTDFLNESNMKDSRQGFGFQPTWNSLFPPFLRIPIDHVLLSETVDVKSRRVGPRVGSDHRAIVIDLVVGKPEEKIEIN